MPKASTIWYIWVFHSSPRDESPRPGVAASQRERRRGRRRQGSTLEEVTVAMMH